MGVLLNGLYVGAEALHDDKVVIAVDTIAGTVKRTYKEAPSGTVYVIGGNYTAAIIKPEDFEYFDKMSRKKRKLFHLVPRTDAERIVIKAMIEIHGEDVVKSELANAYAAYAGRIGRAATEQKVIEEKLQEEPAEEIELVEKAPVKKTTMKKSAPKAKVPGAKDEASD